MSEPNQRKPTRVGTGETNQGGRRETQYYPGPSATSPGEPSDRVRIRKPDNRRIVGVLMTNTWRQEGELFPVREGRNHIGAGLIKDDPEHNPVEVQCPQDDLLSSDHALILVQHGDFYIQDLASVNGTFVNDKKLRPETTEDLPSPAVIKAGRTYFSFLKFDMKAEGAPIPAPQEESAAKQSQRPPTKLR